MRITYDSEVDALYIRFKDTTGTTRHLENGVSLDYDTQGNLAGIEILDATKILGGRESLKKVILEDLAAQPSP